MKLIRIIPLLLFDGRGLVKTECFAKPAYIGDPVNSVRIFNEKEADELILLDITATLREREPDFDLIKEVAGECFMPLCYGGGISSLSHIEKIIAAGVEKVSLNTAALRTPELVRAAAKEFGSQSIVISVDVLRNWFGKHYLYSYSGAVRSRMVPEEYVRRLEDLGAGEILVNSVNRDGTMKGYDTELVSRIASAVQIPVVAAGGAGSFKEMVDVVSRHGASAAAAGSIFVFQGRHRAVLISYPTEEKAKLESDATSETDNSVQI